MFPIYFRHYSNLMLTLETFHKWPLKIGLKCLGDREHRGDRPLSTKAGFSAWIRSDLPAIVFKCNPPSICPGNNTCRAGFDVALPACGGCLPDHYRSSLKCTKCMPGDKWVAISGCGAAVLGLITCPFMEGLARQSPCLF